MIILFGPPGSGKSMQGQKLAEKYGWKWLSVGQVLRDTEDPEILATQQEGELVDDALAIRLMSAAMAKAEADGQEAVLDGYPRNLEQAEWIVEHDLHRIEGAVMLDVPRKELIKRIEGRGREDDTVEAVERRIEIFEQNIYTILSLLGSKNVKITTVDGSGSIEETAAKLEVALRDLGALDDAAVLGSEPRDDEERSYGE